MHLFWYTLLTSRKIRQTSFLFLLRWRCKVNYIRSYLAEKVEIRAVFVALRNESWKENSLLHYPLLYKRRHRPCYDGQDWQDARRKPDTKLSQADRLRARPGPLLTPDASHAVINGVSPFPGEESTKRERERDNFYSHRGLGRGGRDDDFDWCCDLPEFFNHKGCMKNPAMT